MSSVERIGIVTGAGSGVGRHATLGLLKEGFKVVLAGRRIASLEETVDMAGSHGANAMPVATDVADPASVRELFSKTRAAFGRLDLLFNNAGTNIPATPIEDITLEQWQAVLATNLTGAFLCTQQAFRLMKTQQPSGGRIINNGSVSAQVPRPHAVAYNATKHAITGLTKSTSLEGRPHDIACGQIDIGNAETDMAGRMKDGVLQPDGSIAVEPTIDAQHVARAIVYMASLPLDANVPQITVMANKMPFIGRG